ncbi:hypothetical protein A3F37_01295 [Candidatus Saccharibacteria bacterium RIFCSPHIGHO2_12_FULL_41_12]|nr:MAG: hypothetical protein A3F37_01295 [Candidatus Saccharibacteria bacterium RIFCSPHIGHO2_12_FULL_41_12]
MKDRRLKNDIMPRKARTKLFAVAAGLAIVLSGCGKDNSSVHDIVLGCSDKSKTPKNFAVINLNDRLKLKGLRSHRTDSPFNTSSAHDSFPEDRSLSASAILYSCSPDSKQTNDNKPPLPEPEQNATLANHDRSVTLSLSTSEPDVTIGARSYVGGNIFDGDIPLGPNTEGTLVYAVKNHGDEPNGDQAKLSINSVTGIYPDEVKFHSGNIKVDPTPPNF